MGAERLPSIVGPDKWQELNRDFNFQEVSGQFFFVDTKGSLLLEGESRVYPYFDEAADLLETAASLDTRFELMVDAFAGGGHSMLPILKAGIAERGIGIDVNPRAVALATTNAQLNEMDDVAKFVQSDIHSGLPRFEGKTLYIANAPFALTPGEIPHDIMRDGGADGLKLARVFINQATINTYVEEALTGAKPGDIVMGVAYSRIGTDGHIELSTELDQHVNGKGTYEVELLAGRKLWRGANGKKEQPNPMGLDMMYVKAEPGPDYEKQMAEYHLATKRHLDEGYNRLGYFRYIVRVGAKS